MLTGLEEGVMKRSTAEWIYNKMNDIRNFEDRVHGLFALFTFTQVRKLLRWVCAHT